VPAGGECVRFWDFAGTVKSLTKRDPDFTAAVKIRRVNGIFYVTDSIAEQLGPVEAERLFVTVTRQDADDARRQGSTYAAHWELEPGSASLRDNARLAQLIAGIPCGGVRPMGDKITRAKALASQAEAGNVKLLRGPWNERWLAHMHSQPATHDDTMDGSSGAFNCLATYNPRGILEGDELVTSATLPARRPDYSTPHFESLKHELEDWMFTDEHTGEKFANAPNKPSDGSSWME